MIFNTPASASEDETSTAHQCWSIDSLSCRFQEWERTDLWCHSYSEGRHFLFYVRMPLYGDWWLCIYIHLFVSSRDQTSHQPESVVKASLWRAGLQQRFLPSLLMNLDFIFFLLLDYLFLNVPKRWKLASHNFPETREEVFKNPFYIFQRHKSKILPFEKLDPADKATHFFCYFAFKISQMTDWFLKKKFLILYWLQCCRGL